MSIQRRISISAFSILIPKSNNIHYWSLCSIHHVGSPATSVENRGPHLLNSCYVSSTLHTWFFFFFKFSEQLFEVIWFYLFFRSGNQDAKWESDQVGIWNLKRLNRMHVVFCSMCGLLGGCHCYCSEKNSLLWISLQPPTDLPSQDIGLVTRSLITGAVSVLIPRIPVSCTWPSLCQPLFLPRELFPPSVQLKACAVCS